jgi:8-oxo-dGTP pyrophosphatase MutT (NUDIX family)
MSSPANPAATLLLLRDAPPFEVLMVRRAYEIDFAGGALVFPGGRTHAADHDAAWDRLADQRADWDLGERARRIAAVREAFEESGLLLARTATARGFDAPLADADAVAGLSEARAKIAADARLFAPSLEAAGLVLALDALTPFAHWITPQGMPKRFDTSFYLARAPETQASAFGDGREAVEAVWVAPAVALEGWANGELRILFPTRLNLEKLAESGSAEEAIAAAASRTIVTVEPRIVKEGDALVLAIPAEAGYSVTREPLERNL